MILVDTSVWVDHLRAGDEQLVTVLDRCAVMIHPFVLGEIACGNLHQRGKVLSLLEALPRISKAHDDEVLFFIEKNALMGQGIGYVDAHLLAAVALQGSTLLWTRDKRLQTIGRSLGFSYDPS